MPLFYRDVPRQIEQHRNMIFLTMPYMFGFENLSSDHVLISVITLHVNFYMQCGNYAKNTMSCTHYSCVILLGIYYQFLLLYTIDKALKTIFKGALINFFQGYISNATRYFHFEPHLRLFYIYTLPCLIITLTNITIIYILHSKTMEMVKYRRAFINKKGKSHGMMCQMYIRETYPV